MLKGTDFIKSLLLERAWMEAHVLGGVRPMQMVAQCLANRVRLGWGTWSYVLSSMAKYSAYDAPTLLLPDPGDPTFTKLLPSIDAIYDNTFEDLVKGGVFWCDLGALSASRMVNSWFETNVMSNQDRVKTVMGTFAVWK